MRVGLTKKHDLGLGNYLGILPKNIVIWFLVQGTICINKKFIIWKSVIEQSFDSMNTLFDLPPISNVYFCCQSQTLTSFKLFGNLRNMNQSFYIFRFRSMFAVTSAKQRPTRTSPRNILSADRSGRTRWRREETSTTTSWPRLPPSTPTTSTSSTDRSELDQGPVQAARNRPATVLRRRAVSPSRRTSATCWPSPSRRRSESTPENWICRIESEEENELYLEHESKNHLNQTVILNKWEQIYYHIEFVSSFWIILSFRNTVLQWLLQLSP